MSRLSKSFTLIHTALKHEAKPIIEHYKLQCLQKKPYKIYKKDDILLVISGMGKEKTSLHVKDIFEKYKIKKAINMGIAGCKNSTIDIGSLFTCKQKLENIEYASLTTVDKPLSNREELQTTLVDMEADAFLHVSQQYLQNEDIYILKVVSDYLDTTIPKKEFVWKIIEKNLNNISSIVTTKS